MGRTGKGEPTVVTTDITARVLPRSSRERIVGWEEGVLRIKLTAPPVEGKANKALKNLVAKRLGVPKGDVEITSGERSRTKSLRIYGLTPQEVYKRLSGGIP